MLTSLRDIPDIVIPTNQQLKNYLSEIRKKNSDQSYGSGMCLKDFENFYELNKNIPEDEDEMFVTSVHTETKKESSKILFFFRIFFSTKRLLRNTEYVKY